MRNPIEVAAVLAVALSLAFSPAPVFAADLLLQGEGMTREIDAHHFFPNTKLHFVFQIAGSSGVVDLTLIGPGFVSQFLRGQVTLDSATGDSAKFSGIARELATDQCILDIPFIIEVVAGSVGTGAMRLKLRFDLASFLCQTELGSSDELMIGDTEMVYLESGSIIIGS